MRYVKLVSVIAASASLLITSCHRSKNNGLPVPQDASSVVRISGASLSSKANWNDLIRADWFSKQLNAKDSFDKQLIEHPDQSGMNLKSDFVLFTHKKDLVSYSVFEGSLKDVQAFETMLKKKNPGRNTEDAGSFRCIQTGRSDLVTWTESKFIYISSESQTGGTVPVPADSLKAYATALYELNSSNSLESNGNYATLQKENGDIHFWANSADALSGLDFGPLPLIAASPFMQGSTTAGIVNFENGKVVIRSRQYLNPTLSSLIGKYQAKPLTAELLNHVSPNASIVIAMSYQPQLVRDFLKVSGTRSSADKFLEDVHLNVDELMSATRGDLLFTASELGPQRMPAEEEEEGDDIFPFGGNLLLALSTDNDSSFRKIETVFKQQFPSSATRLGNNWFLAGSSPAAVSQFLTPSTNAAVTEKLGGHPLGIYIDIQKGLQQWNVDGFDSSLLKQIAVSKTFWQDIVSTGGEFSEGCIHFETSVNLMDKSTNSLEQLAKYGIQMSALQKNDEYAHRPQGPKKRLLAYNF